jgi:hypothetical protein
MMDASNTINKARLTVVKELASHDLERPEADQENEISRTKINDISAATDLPQVVLSSQDGTPQRGMLNVTQKIMFESFLARRGTGCTGDSCSINKR